MKKIISLVLAFVMTVCFSVSVNATDVSGKVDEDITVYYLYTSGVTSGISISAYNVTCSSIVRGKANVTKITVTQELQKKSGSTWTSIYGWGKTVFNSETTLTNTKASVDSGTYRVKTIAKVYNGSNYETVTSYSSSSSC